MIDKARESALFPRSLVEFLVPACLCFFSLSSLLARALKASSEPSVLARVGSKDILANDLLAYERSIEMGDSIGYEEHIENLKVLIDRELLIAEAQGRGLEERPRF